MLLLQHKPSSFLSPSTAPRGNKRYALDLLCRKNLLGKWSGRDPCSLPLVCIGRLDADSTGLMLWTTDVGLADKVKHPASNIEKEYLVRVQGDATGGVVDAFASGVLDYRPAKARWLNETQLQVTLTEGKHRQIRYMCAALGLTVLALKRVRIGCIRLGGLPTGFWSPAPAHLQRRLLAQVPRHR